MSKKEDLNYFSFESKDASLNPKADRFEDISSSSSEIDEVISLSEFSGRGNYRRKSHGFWGKIAEWWKNRKKWQKALLITAVSILLVLAIVFGVLLSVFDYNYNKISKDDLGFENVLSEEVINIALFGIDTRNTKSFKGNSDSIMILSLNTETKEVKIISVMRDTLVPITYNGRTCYRKINSAYATGGPELAIKTLNTVFNLDISEYATVNFFGMADIIEAVGGIEAELTEQEVVSKSRNKYAINGCISEICSNLKLNPEGYYVTEAGKQHLNGVQAVAYSRIRYVANIWGTNNDYGRTDRQRYVMEQLFNKAVTLEKSKYVSLVKSLIPCSETSLSYTEIMGLAVDVLLHSPTFEQTRIPQQEFLMTAPTNTGAGSVVYYDLEFAAKVIHAFIYDDISLEAYVEENGIEKNDWYANAEGTGRRPTTPQRPSSSSSVSSSKTSSTSNPSESSSNESNSNEISSSEESTGSDATGSDDTTTEDTGVPGSSSEDTTTEPSTGSSEESSGGGASGGESGGESGNSEPVSSEESTPQPESNPSQGQE